MGRQRLLLGLFAGAVAGALALGLLLWTQAPRPPRPAPAAKIAMPAGEPAPPGEREGIADVPCWFPVPDGHRARCGRMAVRERADVAGSRLIHLAFVVFAAASESAAAPIVYISGGPGEPAHIDADGVARWWQWIDREPWLRGRDVVVFDQRGAGLSEPRMDCPELAAAAYRVYAEPMTPAAADQVWAAAAGQCHRRLLAAGIDLDGYSTATAAADVRRLIEGLGYRAPVLLASSYGTRVALRLAAEPDAEIGAMVLDSVDPPDAPEYVDGAPAAARAIGRLFQQCADEPPCRRAFPDLAGDFATLVRQAEATPLRLELPDPRGGRLDAALDDGKLIETLFSAFYDRRRIAELPAIIAALARGDSKPLEPLAREALDAYVGAGVSHGLYLAIECRDEFPFAPRAAVEQAAAATPLFRNFALSTLTLAACPAWPVAAAAGAHQPAASAVPILMLSGELDPVTPPQWATQAARRLPHAYHVVFPAAGHGVLSASGCSSRIVARFLADPTKRPYDDCLLALQPPRFKVPATAH
jgi:pimeloyl-ACP methyl ester carboxylesterase